MEHVIVEINEGIALVMINRPKQLNALNKQTLEEIAVAFEAFRDNNDVKVVILTGSGESFCCGRGHKGVCRLQRRAGTELAKTGHMTVFNIIEEFLNQLLLRLTDLH